MDEQVAGRLKDREVAHDARLLGDFTDIYCAALHAGRARAVLESAGASFGVYRRRLPVLCDECAEFVRYAERRRALCPKDPKPFCVACDTHCYKSDMRQYSREVMRYAGPKSWKRGYVVDGLRHAIAMRAFRKTQQSAATGGADNREEAS